MCAESLPTSVAFRLAVRGVRTRALKVGESYACLAGAIIGQALRDWRAKRAPADIAAFLTSEWFGCLAEYSGVDAGRLLRALERGDYRRT